MRGWKALADLAAKAYNHLDTVEKAKCNVYAENYGQAGAIQFYSRKYNLPKPICFSDSYLLWAPDTIGNGPLIYINDEVGDIDELYKNYEEIGRIDDPYFRESGVQVYLCRNPRAYFREFYREKVWELKGEYRR